MKINIIKLNHKYLEQTINLLNQIFPEQDEEENVDTCFRASLDPNKYQDILNKWQIAKLEYFLAIDKEEVVGTSGIYEMMNDQKSAWVGWTAVHPEYRQKGIGKNLMHNILFEAKKRGYHKIKLHTVDIDSQKNAHRLYESVGFKFIHREKKREIGHDRLYYEIDLI